MFKKGPFVVESFVNVHSFAYDHTFLHNTHTSYKTLEEYKRWNLHIFELGSWMHLKFSPSMGYTHCGIHHTCLRTLFYEDHSSKSCTFIFMNSSIIKKTHKFIATYVCCTKGSSHGLTKKITWNYEKENMSPKFRPQPFMYLQGKKKKYYPYPFTFINILIY